MNLKIINRRGQEIDLLNNDRKIILYKAESLHGVDTDIATSESPYIDGVSVENVKALPRGIKLSFKLQGDIKESINFFTNIIKSKQIITLVEEEDGKEITIKGVATIPPYSRMLASCEIILDIYCGDPYWQDLSLIVGAIASKLDKLNFPNIKGQFFTPTGRVFGVVDTSLIKSFENTGDTSVGMIIYITALGEVVNPQIGCSTGEQDGYYMRLNITLKENDEVKISTVKGEKYITINGLDTYNGNPVLSYLEFKGLDWLQLETGVNTFEVVADSGQSNVYFTITYRRKYE